MVEMEALQVLVEHGTKLEKAGKNKGEARHMEEA
jgi:4-hydroxy-L-threonine phosphate dehydrogenase PdxA